MPGQQPTYEDLVASVNTMKTDMADYKVKLASYKAMDDDEHDKTEAAFKQAKRAMDDDDKEHNAQNDEHEKVKDAFKKAQDETDPDKKHEAMKKAMDMKEEHDKGAKKGKRAQEEEHKDKEAMHDDKEKDAKIANLENKWRDPIVQKILIATKQIDPTNYSRIEKELKTASLAEVESKYSQLKPYLAAIGLEQPTATPGTTTMIPFQAASALDQTGNPTDIMTASVDDIDFSKISTKAILEMYQ
jgi:flagellar biosynthesis GTPase FlhF